ncbi:SLC13 family permease [Loktanella agnita]|uniref:SLC13 family permease n=1 Tax=Loktanella agnita TaxID=287097 RepID=UPI003987BFA0
MARVVGQAQDVAQGPEPGQDAPLHVSSKMLIDDPILGQVPGIRLASLLAHATRRHLSAGETLYSAGEPAAAVYLLQSGTLRLEDGAPEKGRTAERASGPIGAEALLGATRYSDTARAVQDADLIALPARVLADLTAEHTPVREAFFNAYAARFETDCIAEPHRDALSEPTAKGAARDTFGWLLAIAAPIAVYLLVPSLNLGPEGTDFLAILAVSVCMWLFTPLPEYVPPLFAALAVILLEVATPEEALSGFRSESFFMCLSVFGLGAVMMSSGLTYRLALWLLVKAPPTQLGYNASLFGLGALLSPIIPSVVGRVSIVAPVLIELIGISEAGDRDRYANRLIYSLLAGAALLVPIFLTASVPNLIVYGLLDPQTKFAFDWGSWFWAASVYGVLMLVAFMLVSAVIFRGARRFSVPKHILREQQRMLGPIKSAEWVVALAVLAMAAGILTETLHRVDFPWVALAVFVTLMLLGSLGRDSLRGQIDWPVLVYIGAIVGWVSIAYSVGLDSFVIANLSWLGDYMQDDLPLFLILVAAVILTVRLALPTGVTVVLMATALFPLADDQGMSMWVVGFIILAMSDTFIFPYQSSYFLKLRNDMAACGLEQVCDARRMVAANLLLIALRIGALYACLFFWSWLDLI